ncbi:hypothetical protein FCM30_18630 [Lelliottia aquatilis]|uniref:hypothetical protein n=1 Tax=Lelliottia aquatilis TaxID=2080838 RepID=UPI001574F3FE|nr:hypothetical protein [Lelliottia aquatilis]NTZ47758.1 hypothetical protein [Lelliottia aquatilis]
MDTGQAVYIMTCCEYFRTGMESLIYVSGVNLVFVKDMGEVMISDNEPLVVLLVLDMSSDSALRNFKSAVDYLNQINVPKKIGVLVSRYNSYLTYYINRKFHGKVTFFNSHNLRTGLFQRNFTSWLSGKRFRSMHVVTRFRDDRYGFSLKEWVSLVIPLSGETMLQISECMGINNNSMYQVRQNALKKIGISSYRQFCELYIGGKIRIENDRIVKR